MDDKISDEAETGGEEQSGGRFGDFGSGLVEYALLTALIAMVALASMQYFAGTTTETLSTSTSAITNANEP